MTRDAPHLHLRMHITFKPRFSPLVLQSVDSSRNDDTLALCCCLSLYSLLIYEARAPPQDYTLIYKHQLSVAVRIFWCTHLCSEVG